MKVKHSIKCVRCPNVVDLYTDPESLILFQEGKLLIQECFTELTDVEREMLLSGFCPTCWDDLFGNLDDDYEEEEPHTMRDKNPTTFWQAVKCCWTHRHHTTVRFEWIGAKMTIFHNEPKTVWNGCAWAKITILTTKFPVNYGRAETEIRIFPLLYHRDTDRVSLRMPWRWLQWNSEHIASLLGEEQIDGPGPGYGTTYHYEGWLGYHLAL